MKDLIVRVFAVFMVIGSLNACHSGGTNKEILQDTARRITSDTSMIPGTPGVSGTEPRPGDTTQAHRDSLKRAANISDSSGRAVSKP
jgi:hypothetical protein